MNEGARSHFHNMVQLRFHHKRTTDSSNKRLHAINNEHTQYICMDVGICVSECDVNNNNF